MRSKAALKRSALSGLFGPFSGKTSYGRVKGQQGGGNRTVVFSVLLSDNDTVSVERVSDMYVCFRFVHNFVQVQDSN